ncbi:uncharacterized protein VP01_496g15 [Puccinia sorghi]|uniref:Reverse transcriptase Ty1/copia-type domain-containing protein n=1 Tax=Puccinia sorghi TaxID=27349 RepID=A0A0L6ULW9_9BASI|nr:uncharacterized protein VP01_496g15 [Puccinia sorghi]
MTRVKEHKLDTKGEEKIKRLWKTTPKSLLTHWTPHGPSRLRKIHMVIPSINQFNIQGAFLHSPLSEDVFFKIPKGVNHPTPYLKLKIFFYGLKQSPKTLYEALTGCFHSFGFSESNCDPCLYICNNNILMVFFQEELNPLIEAFNEGIWLKALLAEIWKIQLDSATT